MSDDRELEQVVKAVLDRLGDRRPAAPREISLPLLGESAAPFTTPRGSTMPKSPPVDAAPAIDYCGMCVEQERQRAGQRAIFTTTGRNRRGIVARLTQTIADGGGDILDISQTLVSDYFTMIIVMDVSRIECTFAEFKERLVAACRELEVEATIIHEDVMRAFQRV